jgi:4-diphosphocytidyl-2-C-methyl-D-erythritol kinase
MDQAVARFPSPAKINLGLRILGKRPDGFHAIETVLQMLDLCDWLTVRPRPDGAIRVRCQGAELPTDERNLIVRAARLLQQRTHVRQGAEIAVEKRIPIAAGLGGGSSNAAATLLALDRVWNLRCPAAFLHELATQLGSDVPFFLAGPTAIARGRGELLTPLPPPPTLVGVLVNPRFGVSAGWAYEQFGGRSRASAVTMTAILRALRQGDMAGLARCLVNDLEPGVAAVHPVIDDMQAALRASGALVTFMSGSGPTVCGLFERRDAAQAAAACLAQRREWLVMPFATLTTNPCLARRG